ncbi:MAG: hypothetical protein ACKVQK_03990 [Burkholderiales bacterium]
MTKKAASTSQVLKATALKSGRRKLSGRSAGTGVGYDTMQAIRALASTVRDLEQVAALQYLPVVDHILRTRSRDTRHIQRTLYGLLDFCGHEPVLQLIKKLCRHYYLVIDPAATADYVNIYREHWDSDEPEGQA